MLEPPVPQLKTARPFGGSFLRHGDQSKATGLGKFAHAEAQARRELFDRQVVWDVCLQMCCLGEVFFSLNHLRQFLSSTEVDV